MESFSSHSAKRAISKMSVAALSAQIALGALSLGLMPSIAAAHGNSNTHPTCNGLSATIWVGASNHIFTSTGGSSSHVDTGVTYAGTLNGTSGDDVIVGNK